MCHANRLNVTCRIYQAQPIHSIYRPAFQRLRVAKWKGILPSGTQSSRSSELCANHMLYHRIASNNAVDTRVRVSAAYRIPPHLHLPSHEIHFPRPYMLTSQRQYSLPCLFWNHAILTRAQHCPALRNLDELPEPFTRLQEGDERLSIPVAWLFVALVIWAFVCGSFAPLCLCF
jgi:hypothetical protein